ncbi:hypothetical protein CR513_50095, partial [Mucuna pruriens]
AKGQEEKRGEKKNLTKRGEKEDERKIPAKKEKEESTIRLHIKTKEMWRISKELHRAPLDAFKCRIPSFVGDVLAYFNYDDYEKFRMAMYEFIGYALVWLNQLCEEM